MWTLNPWQTLLWIAALMLILLPIIVAGARSIIDGYFESKEKHWGRILNSLGKVIEQIGEETKKKSNDMKEDILDFLNKKLEEDKKDEG